MPSIQGICSQFLRILFPSQFPRLCSHVAAGVHIYYSRLGRSRRTEAMDNILTLDIRHLDIWTFTHVSPQSRGWARFRVETSQIIFRHNRSRGHVYTLHFTRSGSGHVEKQGNWTESEKYASPNCFSQDSIHNPHSKAIDGPSTC